MVIPPKPSIGMRVFNCLMGNFNTLASELVIWETIEIESTNALKFCPSNLTNVSFASPIRQTNGSGLK